MPNASGASISGAGRLASTSAPASLSTRPGRLVASPEATPLFCDRCGHGVEAHGLTDGRRCYAAPGNKPRCPCLGWRPE